MGREARGRAARKLGMKRAADLPGIMVRCSRELEPGFEALLHGRDLDARHAEPRIDKHRAQLVVRGASHVRGVAQTLEPVTLATMSITITRPPGRTTRAISRTAAPGSSMWCSAREVP